MSSWRGVLELSRLPRGHTSRCGAECSRGSRWILAKSRLSLFARRRSNVTWATAMACPLLIVAGIHEIFMVITNYIIVAFKMSWVIT